MAVPIPEPHGGELQRWRESFGDPLAPSIPTHITLLPPTLVADERLPEIGAHLAATAASTARFHIWLRGTATFRPVSPVVFVALVQGIAECERLEQRVRSGPLAREVAFPYHPHVTVAHDLDDEVLDRAFKELGDYEVRFDVTGFSLYEHGTDGMWRPRQRYPFPGKES